MNQHQPRTTAMVFDIPSRDVAKKRQNAGKVCRTHGCVYEEISFDYFACRDCLEEQSKKNALEHRRAMLIEDARSSLSLPGRLQSYSFDNFKVGKDTKQVFDVCRSFVHSWPNTGGIMMLGGVGTGKTHLCVSICKELVERAVKCHITTVNRIIRQVRSSWRKESEESEMDIMARYVEYGLLVIDEIGSQYGTESERIIINEIINDRYEYARPTIVVGNVSMKEAVDILGARVVDRIKDNGSILFFEWGSFRKEKEIK